PGRGSKGLPGVVGNLARPDEVPQGRQELVAAEVAPEEGAGGECVANRVVLRALRRGRGRRPPEERRILTEEQRDPVEPRADPDELARRAQLVEPLGPV